tara:strand:+ start:2083 stop:2913 length:831 start_codon:yes stop_codon:yes gene_type:complete
MYPNIPCTTCFNLDTYQTFCNSINEHPKLRRKQWEFFVIQHQLHTHLNTFEQKNGIGFAVGSEILLPYFIKKGAKIIGTDLDPNHENSKDWIDTNQHLSNNIDLQQIIDKPTFDANFTMDYVDMNNIPAKYLQNMFDFTWSSCALEHLGSIDNGLNFIINSLKCLKSGGIAVHTTEFNLSSEIQHCNHKSSSIYSKFDILNLKNKLEIMGYIVKPIQFDRENNSINNYVDYYPYCSGKDVSLCNEIMKNPKGKAHLNLFLHNKYVSTSVFIVIIKP